LLCPRVVTANPALVTSNVPRQERFIVGGELTEFSAGAGASGQLSGSWAQIWQRHDACPILPSEPVGMSHNQRPPPQQCHEWSDVDSDE